MMSEEPLQVRLEVIDQHTGQYTLSFDSSQYPVTLNPEAITFSDWLRRLRPVLAGGRDPAESFDPQEDLLRNVGTWLWRALFPESAPTQESEALAHLLRTGRTPLLLELPGTLAELPWELLYDPEQLGERGFLARRRPLTRLSAKARAIPPIEPPLRVLLLISSPPSLGEDSRVDVESERAAVEHAVHEMRDAGLLHLLMEDIITPKRVQQVLMRFKPHIVHYIGHGGYDEASGGVLLWEDEQGNELPFSAERLADLLRPRNLYAVVLHACQTGRSNARTDVRGVAGTLVKEGIPAVLAQQANFTYESSQRASEAWYTALTAGESMASALFEVRQALIQADRPDWAVPVLYGSTASLMPLLDSVVSPDSADPLLTSQGAATDLPTPTGVFVGRHRELRALRLMLENMPGSGPVMALITGPGGVGKSTLVAQAVARYAKTYKAALTLRCQGYQSVDLFLQRIGEFLKRLGASSFLEQYLLDPKLSTEAKIGEAIVFLNATGPLLLIIDNLESVQNDDQTISDDGLLHLLQKLLTNLRGGRVLITGRYAAKDLLPQGKFAANLRHLYLDNLSRYETNQLLMRHPTLARLGETVRKKLIDEFGGLPYVYDLLSSDSASQSLDLLIHDVQGRITEAQKRHTAKGWQEVRQKVIEFAALEGTVYRLSEASRVLLAKMSVLHRPFPLAAIEEGLGAVRTAWQPLLDWSLLHYDPQERSYHLHSLTRRYAEGLLEEEARRRVQVQLATWYERYARQYSHDLADYLDAHRLFRAAGRVQQAGQLVIQLAETLRRSGLSPLLRDLCTKTLSDIYESDEHLAASTLWQLGTLAYLQGEYEEARSLYQQSLDIFKQLGDQDGRASSLYQLGIIAQRQGKYEEARGLYQQSLDISEQLGDQNGRASSLVQLGIIALEQEKYEEARDLYQQSLDIFERLGNQSGRADCLQELGNFAYLQGKHEEARDLYQQSLDILEQLGDQNRRASSLYQLGMIAQEQEKYEEARDLCQQSLNIFEKLGSQSGRASSLYQLGMIAQEQEKCEEARGLYQKSLNIFEQLGSQSGRASSLYQLGKIACLQGKYKEACDLYQQSLNIFERLGKQSGQVYILHRLGTVVQEQGEYEQARGFYQQSLEIAEQLGDQSGRASSLRQLGNLAKQQGKHEEACGLYQRSLKIAERLKDQSERGNCLIQLGEIAHLQGEYEEARGFYQQSLEMAEQLGDQSGRAGILHHLGETTHSQGEYGEARGFYQQSLDIFKRLGDQNGQASILHRLGTIAQEQGDYEEARGFYQQSLEIADRLGDLSRRADILQQLGEITQKQGEYEQAQGFCQQSLEIADRLGSQGGRASSLFLLGKIAQEQGEYEEARCLCQQGLDIFEQLEDQNGRGNCLLMLGVLACRQGNAENALMYLIQAYILFDTLRSPDRALVQRAITWIRSYVDEETFITQWRTLAGDRPLVAVAEQEETVDTDKDSALTLEKLPGVASSIILGGTMQQRQQYAAIFMETQQLLPPEKAALGSFFERLAEALRGEIPEVALLEPPFTDLWQEFEEHLHSLPDETSQQEETVDMDEDGALTIGNLSGLVSFTILQGTTQQRQQFAADLVEAQQQLQPEDASLGRFLGCLAAALRGETPEVALLEPSFAELWQAFQKRLRASPDKASRQEEDNDI